MNYLSISATNNNGFDIQLIEFWKNRLQTIRCCVNVADYVRKCQSQPLLLTIESI